MRTATLLAVGTAKAWSLVRRIRPNVVVGFGGYPTVPPLLAASLFGVPTILHEQNSVMGRANKFLAPRVTAIATGFRVLKNLNPAWQSKVTFTGNPVRPQVIAVAGTGYVVSNPKENLLVFGGSQGARVMAEIVPPAIGRLSADIRGRLSVVQQARAEDADAVRSAYDQLGVEVEIAPFFSDLPARMRAGSVAYGGLGGRG